MVKNPRQGYFEADRGKPSRNLNTEVAALKPWTKSTDLKLETGSSILLFLDSDLEANCLGLRLASQYGC